MKRSNTKILGRQLLIAAISILSIAATGCTKKVQQQEPVVVSVSKATLATDKPSASENAATTSSIQVKMTLNKEALLNQEFIYSADLQYSAQYDKDMDLYNQSLVTGHWPASFEIAGDELRLVAPMKHKYPSDVNHPAQLISRYTILAQDEKTITVSAANSATFLAVQLGPTEAGKKNFSVLDHWVRSFDFAPEGNYLLQETSIQLPDGTIAEIMESVFPRASIAPSKDFKKFKMDPESATGAAEDSPDEVSRFRFLNGETVFTGEDKHAWAQHFDIGPKADGTPGTIDWYVTPNIPDEYLEPVKQSVEGWNRYFRTFAGINRDVMQFKGRMPEGIHLGDPRYNIINWDSRTVAGAAYESQSTDPETGKQSHSVIYMPAAWVQIGTDYWNQGVASDALGDSDGPASARSSARFGRKINCSRSLADAAMIAASGRLSSEEVKNFGIELLKQTLFHEVGHALGLAHNFKGSLSWDRTKSGAIFSTSIMDYNDFEIERGAFKAVDSAEGPVLEYDRQALSAIYNSSRDISSSDAVVPTCNDTEADSEDGGVDPLCIRYDNESDPTLSVTNAYKRITEEKLASDITLIQALKQVPALALSDEKVAGLKTTDDLKAAAKAFGTQLYGTLSFYVVSGKMSLSYSTRLNVKSMLQFADDVLPEGYDERAMRERAFSGVLNSIGLTALPDGVNAAVTAAIADGVARLSKAPAAASMGDAARAKTVDELKASVTKKLAGFTIDESKGLARLRIAVINSLKMHEAVPFYLGKLGDAQLDYETAITGILSDLISKKGSGHLASERVAAAKALATFKGRFAGNQAIAALTPALTAERATAGDNKARETIETIITALGI